MSWNEELYTPTARGNTYSLHRIQDMNESGIMCLTSFGHVTWLNADEVVNLSDLIDETLNDGETIELVVSDSSVHDNPNIRAFIVTCWVVYDIYYRPIRFFAALFKLRSDLEFELGQKFALQNSPTFTKITSGSQATHDPIYWLIFTAAQATRLFIIDPITLLVVEIDSIGDVYPGLDLGDLPGSVIRSSCVQNSIYRWSLLGFDTGYVIATTLSLKTNYIVNRSKLKFSGPISVLQYLSLSGCEDKILMLISSTLGPVSVWSIAMTADKSRFDWKKLTVLEDTRGSDAIVCSCIGGNMIAIGTYGGALLIYHRPSFMLEEFPVVPLYRIDHSSSVISMIFLSDTTLTVLSGSGLHLLTYSHDA